MKDFPAFPASASQTGMTLREYYAGQALIGVIMVNATAPRYETMPSPGVPYFPSGTFLSAVRTAWDYADAMIEERKQREKLR